MTEDTKDLIYVIAAILAILGISFFSFIKWGWNILKKILNRFGLHKKLQTPQETIRVVKSDRGSYWNLGKIDNEPAMQINGHLNVTNITQGNIRILSTEIIKPRKARKNCVRSMVINKHPEANVYGSYPLLPNITTDLSIDFWIQPPIIREENDLSITMVLIDQFENRHKVKKLLFKSRNKKKKNELIEAPKELIYKLKNEVEKQVASTLKLEVERYAECGRRVGGLGSVRLKDSNNPGLGTEWRRADSPINQSIATVSQTDYIISENAQALVSLYKKLVQPEEKSIFIKSLLDRLSRDTEYAPVGYLIFLVLFRIDKLELSFNVAREKLYKDSKFGFSDALRLLDGLLRFEHCAFSDKLLDEIEKFIDGLDDHPFRIPERLSAIRTFRLNDTTVVPNEPKSKKTTDEIKIGPAFFVQGNKKMMVMTRPVDAFNFGFDQIISTLNSHASISSDDAMFSNIFSETLNSMISNILTYFKNRINIKTGQDVKINSIPTAKAQLKKHFNVEIKSLIGDKGYKELKKLDEVRGNFHHSNDRYFYYFKVGSKQLDTVNGLKEYCQKIIKIMKELDDKIESISPSYEITKIIEDGKTIIETKAVGHSFDLKNVKINKIKNE